MMGWNSSQWFATNWDKTNWTSVNDAVGDGGSAVTFAGPDIQSDGTIRVVGSLGQVTGTSEVSVLGPQVLGKGIVPRVYPHHGGWVPTYYALGKKKKLKTPPKSKVKPKVTGTSEVSICATSSWGEGELIEWLYHWQLESDEEDFVGALMAGVST